MANKSDASTSVKRTHKFDFITLNLFRVVAVAALLLAGYCAVRFQQLHVAYLQAHVQSQQTFGKSITNLGKGQQALAAKNEALTKTVIYLKAQLNALMHHTHDTKTTQQNLSSMHLLAARVNVEFAEQLLYDNKAKNAVSRQLDMAVSNLEQYGIAASPVVTVVRALAKQVAKVKTVNHASVLFGLDHLQHSLATLRFKAVMPVKTTAASQIVKTPTGWKSALDHSMTKLHGLLVIRQDSAVGNNLVFAASQRASVQEVLLALQQAKFALLQGNQSLYNAALHSAGMAVSHYFVADNARAIWLANVQHVSHAQVADPLIALHPMFNSVRNLMAGLS
jgi:uncharacterized protein HemX